MYAIRSYYVAGKKEVLKRIDDLLELWKNEGKLPLGQEVDLVLRPSAVVGKIQTNTELPDPILGQWLYWSFREPFYTTVSDKERLERIENYRKWLVSKGSERRFYWQKDGGGLLQAFGWMAVGKKLGGEKGLTLESGVPEDVLNFNASSAVRVYGERGMGIGTNLKQVMMRDVERRYPNVVGFWISTREGNGGSIEIV